jgi:hypothetical protein
MVEPRVRLINPPTEISCCLVYPPADVSQLTAKQLDLLDDEILSDAFGHVRTP